MSAPDGLMLLDPAGIESDFEPGDYSFALTAPFIPGDQIYDLRDPLSGSLTVQLCVPYADGRGWQVIALAGRVRVTAPAEDYRLWPAGIPEPPHPPSPGDLFYLGTGGRNAAWAAEQAMADPEFAARFERWRGDMREWERRFREATNTGGSL